MPGVHGIGFALGHVQVDAQPPGLRHAEKQRAAVVHQRAHIHVAYGHDAVERRPHGKVPEQIVQAGEVGLGGGQVLARSVHRHDEGLHVGRLGGRLGLIGIVVLAGDDPLAEQVVKALGGDLGQVFVGASLFQVGLGLLDGGRSLLDGSLGLEDLLVQIRGVDFGHRLSALHAVADIHVAFQNIAGGARQHGRFRQSFDIPGKHQIFRIQGAHDRLHVHHRKDVALLEALRGQGGFPPLAGRVTEIVAGRHQRHQQQHHHQERAAGGRRGGVMRHQLLLLFQLAP